MAHICNAASMRLTIPIILTYHIVTISWNNSLNKHCHPILQDQTTLCIKKTTTLLDFQITLKIWVNINNF